MSGASDTTGLGTDGADDLYTDGTVPADADLQSPDASDGARDSAEQAAGDESDDPGLDPNAAASVLPGGGKLEADEHTDPDSPAPLP